MFPHEFWNIDPSSTVSRQTTKQPLPRPSSLHLRSRIRRYRCAGAASSTYKPGDRVFGGSLGSYAEFICVKEFHLRPIPNQWDLASAAGLAATAPVSYGALITRGGLKKGETVLIHAVARRLGLMAVQIAKATGATVIATASTKEKLGVAKRFGVDECVNYTTNSDWWVEDLELTEGQGVDVVCNFLMSRGF
jgi:NADPH:quinone reductase